jgi:hypothetical protein
MQNGGISMSASKKFFGLIAAALMMGAVAGCGGGGDNPTVIDDNVTVNGGIATDEGTSTESIAAGASQTIDITVNGNTLTDVVVAPTTSNVPAGTPLAVFPANVPIISNLTLGAGLTRDPGQVIVNGEVVPGITVDSQGRLSGYLAFAPSDYHTNNRYEVRFDGPWNIRAGNRTLTVGEFRVGFEVNNQGGSSFPRTITGKLPSNGGSTLDGESFVSFTVDGAFSGNLARLSVLKSNGNISKSIEVPGTSGTFSDLFEAGGNANIPAGGVDVVHFDFPAVDND